MTPDEYEKLPPEEKEHFAKCTECGEIFDRRSLDEVLFHTDHKHGLIFSIPGAKSCDQIGYFVITASVPKKIRMHS